MANKTMPEGFDLEAIKAQIMAELKAEQEEKQEAAVWKPDPELEEYIEVELFKDGKDYKDDVSLHINGENCVVKRGVPVKIKKKFYMLLKDSERQNLRAAEYAQARQDEFRNAARQLGI